MCFVVWIGAWNYKPVFYKMGIIIYRKKIKMNKNYMNNDIGKIIEKDYSSIKILNENKFLFYSHTKNAVEDLLTWRIVPKIIFGEININNDNVIINFKLPIFIIPLLLFYIGYEIYTKSFTNISILFIFLGVILGFSTVIQILIISNMKFEIEYYICNEI